MSFSCDMMTMSHTASALRSTLFHSTHWQFRFLPTSSSAPPTASSADDATTLTTAASSAAAAIIIVASSNGLWPNRTELTDLGLFGRCRHRRDWRRRRMRVRCAYVCVYMSLLAEAAAFSLQRKDRISIRHRWRLDKMLITVKHLLN